MRQLLVCLILSTICFSFTSSVFKPDPQNLIGTWQIDLRPTPNSEPYYQTMEIKSVKNGQIKGIFYYSDISQSNINNDWQEVHGAFQTSDANTTYYTSFKLVDGKLEGTTHAPNRDFLAVWTGKKVK